MVSRNLWSQRHTRLGVASSVADAAWGQLCAEWDQWMGRPGRRAPACTHRSGDRRPQGDRNRWIAGGSRDRYPPESTVRFAHSVKKNYVQLKSFCSRAGMPGLCDAEERMAEATAVMGQSAGRGQAGAPTGLTDAEARARLASEGGNAVPDAGGRSWWDICRRNLFT